MEEGFQASSTLTWPLPVSVGRVSECRPLKRALTKRTGVVRRWSAALPDKARFRRWPEGQLYPNGSSRQVP